MANDLELGPREINWNPPATEVGGERYVLPYPRRQKTRRSVEDGSSLLQKTETPKIPMKVIFIRNS